MAGLPGTATSAASFITGHRVAVLVFPAPKLNLLFLRAFDTSLAHFLIVLYFSLRKLSVFPENDVEAKSEDAKSNEDDSSNQYFHI